MIMLSLSFFSRGNVSSIMVTVYTYILDPHISRAVGQISTSSYHHIEGRYSASFSVATLYIGKTNIKSRIGYQFRLLQAVNLAFQPTFLLLVASSSSISSNSRRPEIKSISIARTRFVDLKNFQKRKFSTKTTVPRYLRMKVSTLK